jgi:hypothetical protein
MRAIIVLQLGKLALQPVDAMLDFFNGVESPFEPSHPTGEILKFLLKASTELVDFFVVVRV